MDRQSGDRTGRNEIKMDLQSGDRTGRNEIGKQEIGPEGIIKMGSGDGRSRHHQHIPEEIIDDIVVKFPVKSLFRFKTVSKSWFNLIKTDDFIYKHSNNRSRRILEEEAEEEEEEGGSYLAMCWLCYDEYPYIRPFLDVFLYELCGDTFAALPSQQNKKKSFQIPGRPPCIDLYRQCPDLENLRLVSNCNGTLCFDDNGIIMLVNPFLSELKRLPGGFLTQDNSYLLGFGFDKTIMDFKVVRIFVSEEKKAEVYSVRSNAWRKLEEISGIPLIQTSYDIPCTFFNGKLFWIVLISGTGGRLISHQILIFNLATEIFQLMEYPECFPNKRGLYGGFIVSNQESLPFLAFVFCSNDGLVDLWKVNDNEEEELTSASRWSKLYSIQCSPHFFRPVCFSISKKHNTFIYLRQAENGYFHLIKYDVMNQRSSTISEPFRYFQSAGSLYSRYSSFQGLGVCRPSLFSLNSM